MAMPYSMWTLEPKAPRPSATRLNFNLSRRASRCFLSASSSARSGFFLPRATTALSFLEPITAPMPVRPAVEPLSFMMQA